MVTWLVTVMFLPTYVREEKLFMPNKTSKVKGHAEDEFNKHEIYML